MSLYELRALVQEYDDNKQSMTKKVVLLNTETRQYITIEVPSFTNCLEYVKQQLNLSEEEKINIPAHLLNKCKELEVI